MSKVDLKVRASKVVAGLEATETNVLLQTIGKCLDKKIDTKSYVAKLQSGEILPKDKRKPQKELSKKPSSNESSRKKREPSVPRTKKIPPVTETPKDQSSRTSANKAVKSKTKEKNSEAKTDQEIVQSVVEDEPQQQIPVEEPPKEIAPPQAIQTEEEHQKKAEEVEKTEIMTHFSNARQSSAGLTRPKSARPKSGERPNKAKDDLTTATGGKLSDLRLQMQNFIYFSSSKLSAPSKCAPIQRQAWGPPVETRISPSCE